MNSEPAALIVSGQWSSQIRREHRMLSPLHKGRPLRAIGERQNALDPQQVSAPLAGEAAKSAGEFEREQGLRKVMAKRVDAMGMQRRERRPRVIGVRP